MKKENQSILMSGFILGSLMALLLFELPFIDSGDALTLFGSIIGVLGAYGVANYQWRKDKQARIVLGNQRYENIEMIPGTFIHNSEASLSSSKFSDLTIPIINGGESAVYNVTISYDFSNLDDFFTDCEAVSDDLLSLNKKSNKIMINSNKSSPGNNHMYDLNKEYSSSEIPVIMPGETVDIELPALYLEMLQYYCNKCTPIYSVDKRLKYFPVLNAKLLYDNYELKTEEKLFYINITDYSVAYENLDDTFETFESSLPLFTGNIRPVIRK